MLVEEAAQNGNELPGVRNVMPADRGPDIVDDHVAQLLRPVLAMEEIVAERGRNHLWYMFVLANRLGCQRRIAKAHAIFKRESIDSSDRLSCRRLGRLQPH